MVRRIDLRQISERWIPDDYFSSSAALFLFRYDITSDSRLEMFLKLGAYLKFSKNRAFCHQTLFAANTLKHSLRVHVCYHYLVIWNVIQEDIFSVFYYSRSENGEAKISCMKNDQHLQRPLWFWRRNFAFLLVLFVYWCELCKDLSAKINIISGIGNKLKWKKKWKCKYSWVHEYIDQMVPILL